MIRITTDFVAIARYKICNYNQLQIVVVKAIIENRTQAAFLNTIR